MQQPHVLLGIRAISPEAATGSCNE